MATLDRLVPPSGALPTEAPAWSPRRAIAAVLIAAAAIALLQVFQSSSFTNTGQTLQELEKDQSQVQARVRHLEAEIAALSSLDRVERAARDRLGMAPPKTTIYVAV